MPELPEVEHARGLAERVAQGRRITKVVCAPDEIVFEKTAPATIRRALAGRTVRAVRRRGKHIWFELDRRPWPCFHFGMTGGFRTRGDTPLRLASSPLTSDAAWPPRFTKLRLHLSDGEELAVTNKRRLGRIRLRHDPAHEPPISELGFDPLLDLPTPRVFAAKLSRRTALIKPLLLDQTFAAGVGNWIADEMLYQARIDPRRRADELSAEQVRRLHAKLKHVIRTAVRADADKSRFPRGWLFHRRWGRDRDATTIHGERIEHLTLGGRTTAWVPGVQR